MVISKKIFRQCGTSRGQMAFTTKLFFCYFISLFFSSICGYNFDRTVARNLQFHLEYVWLKNSVVRYCSCTCQHTMPKVKQPNSSKVRSRDRVYGGDGGEIISFVPLNILFMKSNVVVQISWLHYSWKRFPSINPRNKRKKWALSLDYYL